MASALVQSSDENPTSSVIDGVDSRRKTEQDLKEECEETWRHIQDVMQLIFLL
jgi:hypothetical protein